MKYYLLVLVIGAIFMFFPLTSETMAASSQSIEQVTPLATVSVDETTPLVIPESVTSNTVTSTLTIFSLAGIGLSLLGMLVSSLGLFFSWRKDRQIHNSLIINA